MARSFEPLRAGDVGLGSMCRLCGAPLLLGQSPSLIVDSEATYTDGSQALARKKQDRPHNAVAAMVHWNCVIAFGLEDA